MTIDPIDLAKALIASPSVTPATGAVFGVLEAAPVPLCFTVERFIDGLEPDGPVYNLLAFQLGAGPVTFGFAAHLHFLRTVLCRSDDRRLGITCCNCCCTWSFAC